MTIEPARSTPTGGQIAETPMDIRDKKGDIVLAAGAPTAPIDVSISGVTVDGNGVFAKAGIVYLDAEGALVRDRVTGIVTSISNFAEALPGGYRSNEYGYGIAQVTAASGVTGAAPRPLVIDHTRVDSYNKLGILIDGGTTSSLPVQPSGVVNEGQLEADQVVGRVECLPFNTPKPPPYVLGGAGATPENELPGNCSTVKPTTVGATTFGQDGVRVAAGAKVSINDSTISQNLVNGEASPVYSFTEEVRRQIRKSSRLRHQQRQPVDGRGGAPARRRRLDDHQQQRHRQRLRGHQPERRGRRARHRQPGRSAGRLVGALDRSDRQHRPGGLADDQSRSPRKTRSTGRPTRTAPTRSTSCPSATARSPTPTRASGR